MSRFERDIRKIADYYGKEPQSRQLQEECAELTVIISHMLRGKATKADLVNEIVDVQITLAQIVCLYDITSTEVEDKQHEKLTRQLKRIETEKEGELPLTLNRIENTHITLDSLASELALLKFSLTKEKNEPKTMLEDYKEKHPNCKLNADGTPFNTCPHLEYKINPFLDCEPLFPCVECWNRPLGGD